MDTEFSALGVVTLTQSLHQSSADVHGSNMGENSGGDDCLFHALLILWVQTNLQIHLPQIQADLHRNPKLSLRRFGRPQDRSSISS
jgi:hypothetical protein